MAIAQYWSNIVDRHFVTIDSNQIYIFGGHDEMKQNKFINNIHGKPYVRQWKNGATKLTSWKRTRSPASPLYNFSYIIEGNKKPRFVSLKNSTYLMGAARLFWETIQVGAAQK